MNNTLPIVLTCCGAVLYTGRHFSRPDRTASVVWVPNRLTLLKQINRAGVPCVETNFLPQAQAGEFRRAMFILCTLALMGTEDQLMQAKGKGEVWARLGWWGRLDLRVSSCRNLVVYAFTLGVLADWACTGDI